VIYLPSQPHKIEPRDCFVQALRFVRPLRSPLPAPSNLVDSAIRDGSDAALNQPGHKAVRSLVQSIRERNSEDLALSLA